MLHTLYAAPANLRIWPQVHCIVAVLSSVPSTHEPHTKAKLKEAFRQLCGAPLGLKGAEFQIRGVLCLSCEENLHVRAECRKGWMGWLMVDCSAPSACRGRNTTGHREKGGEDAVSRRKPMPCCKSSVVNTATHHVPIRADYESNSTGGGECCMHS